MPAGLAAALATAWIVGGSVGLMGHPLRNALAWVALGAAAVMLWPWRPRPAQAMLAWVAGVTAAAIFLASGNLLIQVLAPAALCAAIAIAPVAYRRQAAAVAAGITLLGVFRFANGSIPWFWLGADRVGSAIGRIGGRVAGMPLSVGVTFAGVDFLLPMLAIVVAWVTVTPPAPIARRAGRVAYALLAIVAGHLVYLSALARSASLLAILPAADPKQPNFWPDAIRDLLPWDVPVLAGIIHVAILVCMLRWLPWGRDAAAGAGAAAPRERAPHPLLHWALLPAAVLLPALTHLWVRTPSLAGKKIVAYEKGFLNWLRPNHEDYGRLAAGMYGMMPDFVQSLGATWVKSPELSEEDMKGAAALVVIFPDKPWTKEQRERIDRFVKDGGSLLVLGDHTTHYSKEPVQHEAGDTPFNDLLTGTAMRVKFDSALFMVGGWLQSYEALAHPTQEGIGDDRNSFGVVVGASVETHWPARPVLIGRWGWNDPGDEGSSVAMMGNHHYDAGERLGDVILVSEQPVGRGKIVVFGDTSSFTNNITYGAHPYTSRVYAYLADGGRAAHTGGAQTVAMLLAGLVAAILLWRPHAASMLAFCVALGLMTGVCCGVTAQRQEQVPAERAGVRLAYVDASHMEAYSSEGLRPDGLMGMTQTLERNGYQPLQMTEMTAKRLAGASLLISIAPGREFSGSERRAIKEFIEGGGTFISTVGYDRSSASRELLADLGLYVAEEPPPADPGKGEVRAPEPMGHFKSPYVQIGNYQAHVRFWAAWPVCSVPAAEMVSEQNPRPESQIIANGRAGHAAIIRRRIGKGSAVLIGDTGFAMAKNLEDENGQLIEGARENADFWRWLLPYLRGEANGWMPSPPPKPPGSIPDIYTLPPRTAPAPAPAAAPAAQQEQSPKGGQ